MCKHLHIRRRKCFAHTSVVDLEAEVFTYLCWKMVTTLASYPNRSSSAPTEIDSKIFIHSLAQKAFFKAL